MFEDVKVCHASSVVATWKRGMGRASSRHRLGTGKRVYTDGIGWDTGIGPFLGLDGLILGFLLHCTVEFVNW